MAVFSDDDYQRLDYRLMQNGAVTLYFRAPILAEDIQNLKNLNYQIDEFDCTTWKSVAEMHEQIAAKLKFPDYFGRNLDALNDCLSDIEISEAGGRVLVLHHFNDFTEREEKTGWHLLDIFVHTSWLWLLLGKRFFVLVQSDNTKIRFDNLGSQFAEWNGKEWLDASREIDN